MIGLYDSLARGIDRPHISEGVFSTDLYDITKKETEHQDLIGLFNARARKGHLNITLVEDRLLFEISAYCPSIEIDDDLLVELNNYIQRHNIKTLEFCLMPHYLKDPPRSYSVVTGST